MIVFLLGALGDSPASTARARRGRHWANSLGFLWGCPSFPAPQPAHRHRSSASRVCGRLRRCHPTQRKHLGWERKRGVWKRSTNQAWGGGGLGGAPEGPGGASPSGPRVGRDSQSQSLAIAARHCSPSLAPRFSPLLPVGPSSQRFRTDGSRV